MPSDSHYGGPFIIKDKPRKPDSLVSYENKIIENLLNKLPSVSFIYFQLSPNIHSLLVFLWKKYAVSISYTYTIKLENLISDLEWKLKPSARNHIRKCEASGYEFENCTDISLFCDVLATSFNNRNKDLPYNMVFLREVIQTALDNNQGKIFIVKNTEKRNVAGIFCLYDHERVYYYCGTNINDQRQSGALTYCLWEAMIHFKYAGLKTFDFEGSDIKPIEHFFRSFGGELTPIYRVFWCKNIFIRMLAYFQNSNIFG
jgi:lipid II:glycine glycyltransferase (peptidoglycan interpeptide bridge formation enzyme)